MCARVCVRVCVCVCGVVLVCRTQGDQAGAPARVGRGPERMGECSVGVWVSVKALSLLER